MAQFIFSSVLGAENLSYLKSIETHARAFLTLIILAIGSVYRHYVRVDMKDIAKFWKDFLWPSSTP